MGIEAISDSPLARAVRAAGSQSAFARIIGRRQSIVYAWLKAGKHLPVEYLEVVRKETGLSNHDLRPDVFGPGPDGDHAATAVSELAR